MRNLILMLAALVLGGCSTFGGTPAGGASYSVEFHKDGTLKSAEANVLNESDSVELVIEKDPAGKIRTFSFRKKGTSGAVVMQESLKVQRDMLDKLLQFIPVVNADPKK